MKFCKDCKHMKTVGIFQRLHLCAHPSVLNTVTGKPHLPCSQRRVYMDSPCGSEAKQWEAK